MAIRPKTAWNYSYYPVVFESEQQLENVMKALADREIFPRRYFYPSLNMIEYTRGAKMPISESVSSKILCLPLYANMNEADLKTIAEIINKNL